MDFKQLTKYFMLYVMFYAIVTSGPMAEHNNGRHNTIGLGPIGPTHRLPTTTSDNDLFRERSGTLWNFKFGGKFRNFMELYNGSGGTEQLCP